MAKGNQRTLLSKRLLKEGLMRLLEKQHISRISISALCSEAEINRTTFYRYYNTPQDVMFDIAMELIDTFHAAQKLSNDPPDLKNYIAKMCVFLQKNRKIIKVFIRNSTDTDVNKAFQYISEGVVASHAVLYKGQAVDDSTLRLMTTFFAHGMYSLIRQWLVEDIPKSPEEVAELIYGSFNRDFSFH